MKGEEFIIEDVGLKIAELRLKRKSSLFLICNLLYLTFQIPSGNLYLSVFLIVSSWKNV